MYQIKSKNKYNLTNKDYKEIIENKNIILKDLGLIELGNETVDKILTAFIDSPYIEKYEQKEIINNLVELFLIYRVEIENLTDDEIIEYLEKSFNEKYNGAIELLEEEGLEDLKNELFRTNKQI